MKAHSDTSEWEALRAKIIGLGERSIRKSYYPELERRLAELERFRALLDQSNDLIFLVLIPSGRLADVNESACRQLGYSREALLAMSVGDLVPQLIWEKMAVFLADEGQVGQDGKTIITAFRRNGGEMPVELSMRRVAISDAVYAVIVARDIAERKRAEEERQAHLQFFESMDRVNRAMRGTNDLEQMMSDVLDVLLAIFDCDRTWLVYPCDPEADTWQVLMERTQPEYPGVLPLGVELPLEPAGAAVYRILRDSPVPVQFGPGSVHQVPTEVAQGLSVQAFIAMALYPKVGKPWSFGLHQCSYPRHWTPEEERLFKEIGRRLGDALTSLLAYRNLQDSERELAEAQRIAHVGHWDHNIDTGIIIGSDETNRIFGLMIQERSFSLARFLELVHPEDRQSIVAAVTAAIGGGPPCDVEYRLVRPTGEVRFIHSQWNMTRDERGQPRRLFGTVQDITERKHAEEEIRTLNQELEQRVAERTAQLEAANKELEAFAYSVSHDLRAPLRRIDGFLELLQERLSAALDERSQHYMDAISDSAKRMDVLIGDLLSFSRMGRYEISKQRVNLGSVAQDVILELEPEAAGRDIHWQIADLPVVTGDRALLRMALVNLLSNALKFTRPRERAEIEIGVLPEQDNETVIFVRDNGVGFDMAYADKLFGVFQRLHRAGEFEGTGIGLANVRRIIHRHGGRTWAEGEINHGATFYFSLPQTMQGE